MIVIDIQNYEYKPQTRLDALTGNCAKLDGVPEFTEAELMERMQEKAPQLDELTRKLQQCIADMLKDPGGS